MIARCLTAALLVAAPVVAQEQQAVGEVRVRVTDPSRVVVGTLVTMDSERVVVRADPTEGSTCFNALDWEQCVRSEQQGHRSLSHDAVLSFALSDIETLEMSHGTSGKAGLGALIGFGVGAAVGVVAVAMDDPPPPCSPVPGCTGGLSCGLCMGDIISIGPVEAGALLGVVGAGIGAAIRTEKWEPVELRDAKPLVALHPTGRFRVGFTLPVGR